jgi:glyoxylase-like metal-dependent hydrolase (beta-lactamase superfamily II)
MSSTSLITVSELNEKMQSGQDVFILDVRNEGDYNDWKIEGKTVESINVPYFDFLDDDKAAASYEKLPKDKEIVTVCAKGGSAAMVAEMLVENGYTAKTLENGMKAWSQLYHPVVVAEDENVKVIQVNRLSKGCLSYMVTSQGKAMIVDPGRVIEEYLKLAEKENVKIEHIVDTHLHADHISGGEALAKETGATYYISSSDVMGGPLEYEPLEKHDVIEFGAAEVKVLAIPTPGHTPGSTSFFVNDSYLLSGDTIFVGGLGRPDLGGKVREWAEDLYETVFTELKDLSDDVDVLPAHYASITEVNEQGFVGAPLGEIRRNNEIMRTEDKTAFTDYVASSASSVKPPNFEDIVAINRKEKVVDDEAAAELEIGPNRCAVHHS